MGPAFFTLSTMNASALLRVRSFPPCSTFPPRTSMIGLIDSAEASIAFAPPIRPPFLRFSSVSRAPHTLERPASDSPSAAT